MVEETARKQRNTPAMRGGTDTSPHLTRKAVVRRFTVFYVATLFLIATIVVSYAAAHAFTLEPRLRADQDGVNLATQQQEFGLQFSRDALAVTGATNAPNASTFVEDMQSLLPQIAANQATLRGTPGELGVRGLNTKDLDGLYATADPDYQALIRAIKNFLAPLMVADGQSVKVAPTSLTSLAFDVVVTEQTYEHEMEMIAERYSDDANEIVQLESLLDKGLVGATLAALVLVGVLVFRPATRRVGQSIDELAQAQNQQRELAALKDQFIIYANHELRTPVMGLYNSLELLEMVSHRSDDPERRSRLLQRALSAGDALIRLLQNVLDTSVVESQAPRIQQVEVHLAPFTRTVLETFNPREITEPGLEPGSYQSREVTVDIPPEMVVLADEVRLRQVFINLLSNALKYSAEGTPIAITAESVLDDTHRQRATGAMWPFVRRRGGEGGETASATMGRHVARVSVRDRGLGVPPRDAGKLFNRFIRLERDIASTVRGTGVGLYLCRVLIEAMGGRIWLASSGIPGEGTTFLFTLPIVTQPARAEMLTSGPLLLTGAAGASREGGGSA